MKHLRTLKISIIIIALITTLTAQAQEITLTLSHFLSPQSLPHKNFIEPWAQNIEKQSNGKIKIKIFPAMTLGGKPQQLYSQARDGSADIIWTLTGYTAGLFPLTEAFELPALQHKSAYATTMAIQDTLPLIANDFKHIHPILIHTHTGNALLLKNKCVNNPGELKGLKIRTPSRTGGEYISQINAEPVGMPLPSLPQALAKGVVDAALLPLEIIPPYKIQELIKCAIIGPDNRRFGNSVFLFAMNKKRYQSLSPELKEIIDRNSGKNIAPEIGKLWDNHEKLGEKTLIDSGVTIHTLSPENAKILFGHADTIAQKWTNGDKRKTEILKAAQKAIEKYNQ